MCSEFKKHRLTRQLPLQVSDLLNVNNYNGLMTKDTDTTIGLFPALLKYWRGSRGLSQLDLSLAADVSARHVSFLETGRAKPSKEMLLNLANVLNVPLRDQNLMLDAAGFEAVYEEPSLENLLDGPLGLVLQEMLDKQEPYPLVVLNSAYDVVRMNQAAALFVAKFSANPQLIQDNMNIYKAVFHPEMIRPNISNWEELAQTMLSTLYRTSLLNSHDKRLKRLLDEVLSYPGVSKNWCILNPSISIEPTVSFDIKAQGVRLSFISSVTKFNAPKNISVEELAFESFFPLDDDTKRYCYESLAAHR